MSFYRCPLTIPAWYQILTVPGERAGRARVLPALGIVFPGVTALRVLCGFPCPGRRRRAVLGSTTFALRRSRSYASAAVVMGHLAVKHAIRHAEANDLVARNVATLADTPKGQDGRPSRSLTLDQAVAVITVARTLPVLELRPGLKDFRRPARTHARLHHAQPARGDPHRGAGPCAGPM